MGGAENAVLLVTEDGVETWDRMPKQAVADALARQIAAALD